MTQKQETRLRTEIKNTLIKIGATCHVYHGSPMGERGHSDLYGTYRGRAYWFEVKPKEWKPNKAAQERFIIQCDFLDREAKAGAITAVVHSKEEVVVYLEKVDKTLDK